MSTSRKAIIIGGGPAGLATALRLRQTTNIDCTIYELRPKPSTIGGAVGIVSNGLRLLHRLGVYDQIMANGSARSKVTLYSKLGKLLGQQDLVGKAAEETGFGYVRIQRTRLVNVLLQAVERANIPIRYDMKLTAINDTSPGVEITFENGETEMADILIGCDGIHSTVRRLHVDPSQTPTFTGMATLGSVMPSSMLPEDILPQLQGINGSLTEEGMFVAMSCTALNEEIMWFFSKEAELPVSGDTQDGWEVRRKEEVEGFKAPLLNLMADAGGSWGSVMRTIISNAPTVQFYPIFKMPAGKAWSKGRVILLGDAAHAMPPHAGQGVGMALEDAFLLSRLLKDDTASIEDAYRRFESIRRPRIDELSARAAANGDMRRKTGPWGLWFKELGMWAYLNGYWTLGFDRMGSQNRQLVYDIEKEGLE